MVLTNMNNVGEPNYAGIVAIIEKSKPHLRGQVSQLTDFVREWSGGADGKLLHDMIEFSQVLGEAKREIPASPFQMLSRLQCSGCAEFIAACIKACLMAPTAACKNNNESRLLSGQDFAHVGKGSTLHNNMLDAQKLFRVVDAYLDSIKGEHAHYVVNAANRKLLSGKLQARCVMTVLNKKYKGVTFYQTLGDVRKQFALDIEKLFPQITRTFPLPWTQAEEELGAQKGNVATCSAFREFTRHAGGTLVVDRSVLNKCGFKVFRCRSA